MPKTPSDYSKTVVYKFVCNDLQVKDCYVGHTVNFVSRKSSHKTRCLNPLNEKHNFKIYTLIRNNGGWENWTMIEIEKWPCNDGNEARKRERFWFEQLNTTMNTLGPYLGDTKQESNLEYKRINKGKLKQQQLESKICECGRSYTHQHYKRHSTTKFHQDFENTKLNI